MRWGFPSDAKRLVINARSETAPRSRMFGESLRHRRCVICASGYYEWEKPSRRKMLFTMPDQTLLCMAGFYHEEADGPHFVIMTRPALPELESIHSRMPVILSEENALRYCRGEDRLHCVSKLLSQSRPDKPTGCRNKGTKDVCTKQTSIHKMKEGADFNRSAPCSRPYLLLAA
ncbi:MAG: SOS response-associated peptidase family protein [Holdemania massiliensis]